MKEQLKAMRVCALIAGVLAISATVSFGQSSQNDTGARTPSPAATAPSYTPPADDQPKNQNGMPTISMPQFTSVPVTQIGGGDLLEISIYGAPEFDRREFRVSDSGDVSLPMIGPLHVAGLATSEAEKQIAEKMAAGEFYTDPHVSVLIKEFASQGISVLGEVQRPGMYPLLGARRLFDEISLAGGLTPKAGTTASIIHKDHPESATTVPLHADTGTSDVALEPGDTVMVSKAGIVYVVGDVRLPGGFPMENGSMTVLQAVALAQGANNTAALQHSKLIRNTAKGREEIPLSLKDVLAGKAEDVKLQAEDIVFIPNSAAKSAGRRTMEAILQTVTGLAVYGRY